MNFYRPQRSCGKVMFSQACVKSSIHMGVYTSMHWAGGWVDTPWADTPWPTHPPGQTPPLSPKRPLQWTVRILLECILVFYNYCTLAGSFTYPVC